LGLQKGLTMSKGSHPKTTCDTTRILFVLYQLIASPLKTLLILEADLDIYLLVMMMDPPAGWLLTKTND
jgi:hypothetical protein